MAGSFNKVFLMGNLTRDPELKYTPGNTAVANIGIAVNDRWKNKETGEWQERANFVDCEAWGNTAENINKFFRKGRPIFIEGRLKLDQWQDQDGNKRSKLRVVVENFQFVDSRAETGEGGESRGAYAGSQSSSSDADRAPVDEDDIPF